jgi:hypothetical protein
MNFERPKMSEEEIAHHKAANYARQDEELNQMKFVPMPSGCETCKTPLAQCKGLEDPAMDGIHYFDGKWLCDSCLQRLGRIERGLEEP